MLTLRKVSEWISFFVILLTLALFIMALMVKGFTRDLLLEAAVFLVSMKLILSTYQIAKRLEQINDKLDRYMARRKEE